MLKDKYGVFIWWVQDAERQIRCFYMNEGKNKQKTNKKNEISYVESIYDVLKDHSILQTQTFLRVTKIYNGRVKELQISDLGWHPEEKTSLF
jgi:hypothetical protein